MVGFLGHSDRFVKCCRFRCIRPQKTLVALQHAIRSPLAVVSQPCMSLPHRISELIDR
jgi:hypothetical protein